VIGLKLLLTGGSGFLGKRIVPYFEKLDWDVPAPSHSELDITDEAAVLTWFRAHGPAAVIHTAAVSDTGLCQRQPEWSERINVDGCVHLAKACREFGAKLVVCSSDQIYFGSTIPGPHSEMEAVTPCNIYGQQKLRAEQKCLELLPETVCLRLSWMYARENLPGDHGQFLAVLKAALADDRKPLTWPVYDRRGLTDVADVIANLPKALELPGGVWNFGASNEDSTYDTVKTLLQVLKLEQALDRLTPNEEAFADNPRDITMDQTKLNAAGISFPTTLEGLCDAFI
jgi:dTDP-4-dehydrorhamnose reductase